MKILRTKRAKLNFVVAAVVSCFGMMLVTPFIGEQFGMANSFSDIYLDGECIGSIKDPAHVEDLMLEARLQIAKEYKKMVLSEADCYYTPVKGAFARSMSEDELYDILYEYLKNATVDIQRAYMMKIGTYTVYLDTIEDIYTVLEQAKEKYDPDNRFQVNIVADDEREINMYTAQLISSDIKVQDVENVGIRISQLELTDVLKNREEEPTESTEPEETPPEEPEVPEKEEPAVSGDGLQEIYFGEKVEITEAYVSRSLITPAEEAADQITKDSQKNEIYEVKAGDTLSTIANNHGLYVKDVLALNSGLTQNTTLHVGDEIIITVPQPELTVMTVEQSTYEEGYYKEVQYVYNDSWYTTKSVVLQDEKAGYHQVTALITKQNGMEVNREVIDEVILSEPVCKIVEVGTQTPPTYIKPLSGGRQTSGFGYRKAPTKGASTNHGAIDWATPTGTAVWASCGGTVTVAGWQSGYGYVVYINHPDGNQTRYGHLSKILVSVGQKVKQGQKIALSGNTGRSTGPHLHFELRVNGTPVNPYNYIK